MVKVKVNLNEFDVQVSEPCELFEVYILLCELLFRQDMFLCIFDHPPFAKMVTGLKFKTKLELEHSVCLCGLVVG